MDKKLPKIVFLDSTTVDLGDLDLRPLRDRGQLLALKQRHFPMTAPEVREAEIVITNKVVLGEAELRAMPNLRLVCVAATGVNNVDLAAAQARGIGVCNVAGYSTDTVVEHTLMFLLTLSHRLIEHHEAVRAGRWARSECFALLDFPFRDLRGKTLGIVGYGNIGRRVARAAKVLGMNVLVARLPGRKYTKPQDRLSLTELLRCSDFVSLHCPLTESTRRLIREETLQNIRPGAALLNLARGPLVDELDVIQALKQGRLAAYATDVTVCEPLSARHPFLQKSLANKVLLTPHVAWASREARQRLIDAIAQNIGAFLLGKRKNRLV